MADDFVKALKTWQKISGAPDGDALVFPWPRATLRRFSEEWHQIVAAAKLPKGVMIITPKNFRSTCGTELVQAGVPLVVVRDILGHSDIAVTAKHYTNTAPSMHAAIEARASHMAPKRKPPQKTTKSSKKPLKKG